LNYFLEPWGNHVDQRSNICRQKKTGNILLGSSIILLVAIAALNLGPLWGLDGDTNAIVTMLLGLVFTVIHGCMFLGWQRLLVFLAITVGVSFSAEAIGVATGLVFGKYHYTENLGPLLFGVPPLIQVGYVTMGYASFVTARVILGAYQTPRGWGLFGLTIAAACIMVSWDVAMDPYQSTIGGDWIWETGGPYFGVPLHNYVGWFCTVATFIALYLIYERFNPLETSTDESSRGFFRSGPVLYYASMAIGIIITPIVGGITLPIASPNNYSGSIAALTSSLSLIAVFVMGTPVVLAIVRLLNRRCDETSGIERKSSIRQKSDCLTSESLHSRQPSSLAERAPEGDAEPLLVGAADEL
jgi:uncharacterized membrane protein